MLNFRDVPVLKSVLAGHPRDPVPAISALGESVASVFEWFGELALFCGRVARSAFQRPFEGGELLRQMDAIGSKSMPLVALAGAATGAVIALQMHDSLSRFGAKSMQ